MEWPVEPTPSGQPDRVRVPTRDLLKGALINVLLLVVAVAADLPEWCVALLKS